MAVFAPYPALGPTCILRILDSSVALQAFGRHQQVQAKHPALQLISARTLLQRHAYNITMTRSATLTFGDKKLELPVIEGSEGELGVDIGKLRSTTGLITFDPGYGNTGACKSAITFKIGRASCRERV